MTNIISSRFASRSATTCASAAIDTRSHLTSQLLTTAQLDAVAAVQWDSLSNHALAENPFYSRFYMKGGLSTIDARDTVSAFAVWCGGTQLVGLFPFRVFFGTAHGARNIYQFSGAPLVHCDFAEDVVLTWLKAVHDQQLPGCWQLTDFQLQGPLHDLICRTAAQLGLTHIVIDQYSRPQLTRLEDGFEAHLSRVLSRSRRKEIDRCLRRLREKGVIRFERAISPDGVKAALERFLELENAGWKGRAGTSFLAHGDDTRFARAAFVGNNTGNGTMIDTLLLDDCPIAISINITSGSTLFTPKCTYLESLRSFAPGLVLEYLVIERFYSELDFSRMDSATTADGHVIQGLWNESVPMGTLFVGFKTQTTLVAGLARGKSALKSRIKSLRDYFRSVYRDVMARKHRA